MSNYRKIDLPPHCGNCVFYDHNDYWGVCRYPHLDGFNVRQHGPEEDPGFIVDETIAQQGEHDIWPHDCICDNWQEPGDVLAQKDRAFDEAVERVIEILAKDAKQ